MEWRDEGIVLGVRKLGESSVTLEAMTRDHGRHLGLVRGGRSLKLAAVLQPGNSLSLVWRARLDEHLGSYVVEPLSLRAARFLPSALALAALGYLGALIRMLPERDPHASLFDALLSLLDALDDKSLAPSLIARFELILLGECGFALDLSECAATGTRDDLIFVSPKSGRAVSAAAGEPWRDRLLALPPFLTQAEAGPAAPEDLDAAFRLTGHFLRRELFAPRGLDLPDSRKLWLAAVERATR